MDHEFITALPQNKQGKLSEDQLQALHRMFKARTVTAWILVLCGGFLGGITGSALALDDGTNARLFYGLLLVTLAMATTVGYGIAILQSNKTAKIRALAAPVQRIRGIPTKSDFAAPVRVPGPGGAAATHFLHVKAGVVTLEKTQYGVLPGTLYAAITSGHEATFFSIPVSGIGFKKQLIVNYEA